MKARLGFQGVHLAGASRVGLRAAVLGSACVVLLFARQAAAANYVWAPVDGAGWQVAREWQPNGLPTANDTAVFGPAGRTTVQLALSPDAEAGTMHFTSDAPAYTFNVTGFSRLELHGQGVVNDSVNRPTFVVGGDQSSFLSGGRLNLWGNSQTGNSIINVGAGGGVYFRDSSGGSANTKLVMETGGLVDFSQTTGPGGNHIIDFQSITGTGFVTMGAQTLRIGADNSSFEFDGTISDLSQFNNGPDGGTFVKQGTGTFIMAGAIGVQSGGKIIVDGGTLQVGNGSQNGRLSGPVVNNGVVVFDNPGLASLTGVFSNDGMSGTGSVIQQGTGTLNVQGTLAYTGATLINHGTLDVLNASLASSSGLTIASGASLTGVASVLPKTTIQGGATVAPGHDPGGNLPPNIGHLSVKGDLVLQHGATYLADVTSAGNDQLNATGAASIDGTLWLTAYPQTYSYGQKFTFVTAQGGLAGTFSDLKVSGSLGNNIDAVPIYDSTSASVELVPHAISGLLAPGQSSNVRNVALAIDAALGKASNQIFFAPLANLSPANLGSTLSAMAGASATAPVRGAFALTGQFLQLLDPVAAARDGASAAWLRQASTDANAGVMLAALDSDAPIGRSADTGPSLNLWGTLYGGKTVTAADPVLGSQKADSASNGFVAGLDYQIEPGAKVGAALGYGFTSWMVPGQAANGHAGGAQLGLYASKWFDDFYLSAAGTVAFLDVKTQRAVAFSGTNVFGGQYSTDAEGVRLEGGSRVRSGDGFSVTPYLAVQVARMDTPAYQESTLSGSSLLAMQYQQADKSQTEHELGVQLDQILGIAEGRFDLGLRAAWLHDYSGRLFQNASLNAAPGAAFSVYGTGADKDAARISPVISANIADGLMLTLRGRGDIGARSQAYGGSLDLALNL